MQWIQTDNERESMESVLLAYFDDDDNDDDCCLNFWDKAGGCRFNPHYRRVTIQEYLTLVPGYG